MVSARFGEAEEEQNTPRLQDSKENREQACLAATLAIEAAKAKKLEEERQVESSDDAIEDSDEEVEISGLAAVSMSGIDSSKPVDEQMT